MPSTNSSTISPTPVTIPPLTIPPCIHLCPIPWYILPSRHKTISTTINPKCPPPTTNTTKMHSTIPPTLPPLPTKPPLIPNLHNYPSQLLHNKNLPNKAKDNPKYPAIRCTRWACSPILLILMDFPITTLECPILSVCIHLITTTDQWTTCTQAKLAVPATIVWDQAWCLHLISLPRPTFLRPKKI